MARVTMVSSVVCCDFILTMSCSPSNAIRGAFTLVLGFLKIQGYDNEGKSTLEGVFYEYDIHSTSK